VCDFQEQAPRSCQVRAGGSFPPPTRLTTVSITISIRITIIITVTITVIITVIIIIIVTILITITKRTRILPQAQAGGNRAQVIDGISSSLRLAEERVTTKFVMTQTAPPAIAPPASRSVHWA